VLRVSGRLAAGQQVAGGRFASSGSTGTRGVPAGAGSFGHRFANGLLQVSATDEHRAVSRASRFRAAPPRMRKRFRRACLLRRHPQRRRQDRRKRSEVRRSNVPRPVARPSGRRLRDAAWNGPYGAERPPTAGGGACCVMCRPCSAERTIRWIGPAVSQLQEALFIGLKPCPCDGSANPIGGLFRASEHLGSSRGVDLFFDDAGMTGTARYGRRRSGRAPGKAVMSGGGYHTPL